MTYAHETRRRRTFAIISHPDAGKTTLTEKLLLFSGAIQIAGSVKARKASRHATSDWMEIEKQRGISVASSVMQMLYREHVINLLDTPGHKDFSEDTYRVLTAVDSALMVIDAANGVEAQTRRLIEVCRQRDTPIITFVNKMDREVRDPLTGAVTYNEPSFTNLALRHLATAVEAELGGRLRLQIGYDFRRQLEMQLPTRRTNAGLSFGFGLKAGKSQFQWSQAVYHVAGRFTQFSYTRNL